MPRRLGWLVGIASATSFFLVGCLHAPVLWSPDGRWLAYTIAVRAENQVLTPGWLFETASHPTPAHGWPETGKKPSALAYRMWATEAETGVSVLLEESRGPLTSPCWSADGRALAFGRLVSEESGRARFEVVIQDAPDKKRILLSQPCGEFSPKSADLPGLSLAWSADGRYLAVPLFQQTLGLAIIRADNGRLLKVVEDAYLPSWSPDGSKLAFVRGTDSESLHVLDTNFGPTQHLADVGQTSQAPTWTRDKRSLLVVSQVRTRAKKGEPPALESRLMRVPVDGGRAEVIPLDTAPLEGDKSAQGVSFSFDNDGENLYFTSEADFNQLEVTWFHPRTKERYKKDNPVDFTVRIGSLAISPNGKVLAFRAGAPGYASPPGLWDWTENRFTPIVPDDSARVEWISALVVGASRLLGASPAAQRLKFEHNLLLMPAVKDVSSLPKAGKSLVVVAVVNQVLHVRIFDGNGVRAVDTDEKRLMARAAQVQALKRQLEKLWLLQRPTDGEKFRIIAAVTSLVGHAHKIERATVLPVPGELALNSENFIRLRKIGRIGRPLCDRPADAPALSDAVAAILDEARLFFDYLQGDYASALASLQRLEERTTDPDHRLRLLSVRAEIFVGQRDGERAEQTIGYLRAIERNTPRRLEFTPAGPTMTDEPSTRRGWPDYLALRAADYFKTPGVSGDEDASSPFPEGPEPMGKPFQFGAADLGDGRQDVIPFLIKNEEVPPFGGGGKLRLPPRLVPVRPPFLPPAPPPPLQLPPE